MSAIKFMGKAVDMPRINTFLWVTKRIDIYHVKRDGGKFVVYADQTKNGTVESLFESTSRLKYEAYEKILVHLVKNGYFSKRKMSNFFLSV